MIAFKTALAAVAALTFALGAVAGPAGSRNDGNRRIELTDTTVLLGATVRPGSYTLSWAREPGSEEVRLEVTSGKTVVASGKGLWVASEEPSPYEALVYHTGGGGPSELSEIRFRKSANSIMVENGTERADAH